MSDEMSNESYLAQLKRERDALDRQAILDALPTIRAKMAEGVEKRQKEVIVSVDKRVLAVLRMDRATDNSLFFYEEMSKLGFDGSDISWDQYTEQPPYSYTLKLNLGE